MKTTPKCIYVKTPARTIEAVLGLVDVKGKVVYEPGCGSGEFLVAASTRGASIVVGTETNKELQSKAIAQFNGFDHACWSIQKDTSMLDYCPSVDVVYCYLMHGLTESVLRVLTRFQPFRNKSFTLISHNYPLVNLETSKQANTFVPTHIILHNLNDYPPYSLLYRYRISLGIATAF